MEYQTRNNRGELKFFDTFAAALEEAKRDRTVWKLSFSIGDEHYRWRPKTRVDHWSPESERKLCGMSATYNAEPKNSRTMYWVNQAMLAPNREELYKSYSEDPEKLEEAMTLDCILEICTEKDLMARFGKR